MVKITESPPKKKIKLDNGQQTTTAVNSGFDYQNKSNGNSKKGSKEISPINLLKNANKLKKDRAALPISKYTKYVVEKLCQADTNILVGDTGCGKTTQIPQILYENNLIPGKSCLVVTQPRRIAAISVANRVAEESGTVVGKTVGYSVRFEDMTSDETKIKFATDGMILREVMLDPLLRKYSWIILDEAHERTVNTDVLFGVVKKAQRIRRKKSMPRLRILVMSATMETDKFSEYFNNCPVWFIEGRSHKLNEFYTPDETDDYSLCCLQTVMKVHREEPLNHGILVFLTGQDEIERACAALNRVIRNHENEFKSLLVYPLYASLPQAKQMDVFGPNPTNGRRVIISTNIAETSITIPGIRIVIDSGKAKVRTYNPKTCFDTLKVEQISKAEAWQRAGRAGRETDGKCYHAYSEKLYSKMAMNPVPEISRTSLTTVILQLLNVGVKDVRNFEFIDKPNTLYLEKAIEDLLLLGAVTRTDDKKLSLTDEGKRMALFPLEPCYAKILLAGPKHKCTNEVLTIVALLNSEKIFVSPSRTSAKNAAKIKHRQFLSANGDHLTLLKVYQMFKKSKQNRGWCNDNFLNHRNLTYAANVRKQLASICERHDIELISCGEETNNVLKCLISGLFTNVAEKVTDKKYRLLSNRQEAKVHISSSLHDVGCSYLLFSELMNTGSNFMHTVSYVSPEWLADSNWDYFKTRHMKEDYFVNFPQHQRKIAENNKSLSQ